MTLKDASIKYSINYNYLSNLWQRRFNGLPLRKERKKKDVITDFTSDQIKEIYSDL